MKLHECGCGGNPRLTFNKEGKDLFTISCPSCGNSTPGYAHLETVELIWNTLVFMQSYFTSEDATA